MTDLSSAFQHGKALYLESQIRIVRASTDLLASAIRIRQYAFDSGFHNKNSSSAERCGILHKMLLSLRGICALVSEYRQNKTLKRVTNF